VTLAELAVWKIKMGHKLILKIRLRMRVVKKRVEKKKTKQMMSSKTMEKQQNSYMITQS